MRIEIKFTEDAEQKLERIAVKTGKAYVEVLKMLYAVRESALDNHDPFALVNEQLYVYGVRAWRTQFEVLIVVDTDDRQVGWVVDYIPFTALSVIRRRSRHEKDALARSAAKALGVMPNEVRVL